MKKDRNFAVVQDKLMPINVDDWYYLAEGNQYIVLGFKHSELDVDQSIKSCWNSVPLSRMVLKMPKTSQLEFRKHLSCSPSSSSIRSLWSQWFGSNNLTDAISNRFHVEITQSNVCEVLERIESDRPVKRVLFHKLQLQEENLLKLDVDLTVAYLEPNFSLLSSALSVNVCSEKKQPVTTICYDIKVKCGYKSCEPFHVVSTMQTLEELIAGRRSMALSSPKNYIADNLEFVSYHSIRWTCSKYAIMQYYKLWRSRNKQEIGVGNSAPTSTGCNWGEFTCISKYDPLDLCSDSGPRIERAIECLIENPQNNLRVFCDGRAVELGETSDPLAHSDDRKVCCSSSMVSVLRFILQHETMLSRLKLLQSMDILFDVEPVYKRYKLLMGVEAGELSSDGLVIADKIGAALSQGIGFENGGVGGESMGSGLMNLELLHHWSVVCDFTHALIHGDFSFEECACSDHTYCCSKTYLETHETVDSNGHLVCSYAFLVELLNIATGVSSEAERTATGVECSRRWCDSLDATQCQILFFLWLVALTAKDMSIMVSLQSFGSFPSVVGGTLSLVKINPQVATENGLITIIESEVQGCDSQVEYCFRYRLSLVDIELKPCTKLMNKIDDSEESSILSVVYDVVSRVEV